MMSSDAGGIFEAIGQAAYTTAGSYSWSCPAGVTSVSVVCVGSGGGASSAGNASSFDGTTCVADGGGTVSGGSWSGDGGGDGGAGGSWGGGGAGGYGGANLLDHSQHFDNAVWQKARASITANATTAPDGTLTADKLVEDSTASNTHHASASVAATSAVTYCFSVYAKAAERTEIAINFAAFGAFAETKQVRANLSTGAVINTTGTLVDSGIDDIGGGIYRVWFAATATATATALAVIYLSASGTTVYNGDGSSGAYIWGAQLEAAGSASTYETGGNGSTSQAAGGTAGANGGGGGGANYNNLGGFSGGGGGVGILGEGSSGGASIANTTDYAGKGGSGGATPAASEGGAYGGGGGLTAHGGGGGLAYINNFTVTPGETYAVEVGAAINTSGYLSGVGAVRIIWPGLDRQFPSTRTGDE